ncbi:MAG: class I SAM-dependent methyltransferase [Cyclobacteriaceae bacterium]
MRKFAPPLKDLDESQTTDFHRSIILNKPFLKRIYEEWYALQKMYLGVDKGKILEIGSGGGFIKEHLENVITSDIQKLSYCDLCCDASELPFEDEELSAILMINVFHHIPVPEDFLREASRTLKKGGKIILIEPAKTLLSTFIYKHFHHEDFDPNSGWELSEHGKPMSVANGALPWIVFKRDRARFLSQFPNFQIEVMRDFMPLKYIVSGGFSRPSILNEKAYDLIGLMEKILVPVNSVFGMFQLIVIVKK